MVSNFEILKVYSRALDPIHIGAGGYRLGRVDNTIVRDPATNIPKIPGTSISGVIRAYESIALQNKCNDKGIEEILSDWFGDENRKGRLRFYDGQILFFPVSSTEGTIWITTSELLEDYMNKNESSNTNSEKCEKISVPSNSDDGLYAVKGVDNCGKINLGWLLFELMQSPEDGSTKEYILPSEISKYLKRIIVVPDELFSEIINDNLEVRTSVRIDSSTGAAVDGGLFTYEAIPRGTIIGFEIGSDNRGSNAALACKVLNDVSIYFKLLGIGGMETRGFGRLEIICTDRRCQND